MSKLTAKLKMKEAVDRLIVAYRESKDKDEVTVKRTDLDLLFTVAATKVGMVYD